MKFQKGLLDDLKRPTGGGLKNKDQTKPREQSAAIEDDHLFQTQRRNSRSWIQYVKLLGIVSVFVVIAGVAAFYMTLPGRGDRVRGPKGLEDAVRAHFIDVEKRNAGDIRFYYCETYYWAHVDVEKRPDIKTNPVYQIGSYAARAVSNDDRWEIKATPITAPEVDQPCSQ